MLSFTCFWIIGNIYGTVSIFVYDISMDYGKMKMLSLAIGIPWLLYFDYRYEQKKSIVQNKYQIFRERWGEPERVRKKNMRILLWYTILSTIGLFVWAIIMGYLNTHGVFAGYRLFP